MAPLFTDDEYIARASARLAADSAYRQALLEQAGRIERERTALRRRQRTLRHHDLLRRSERARNLDADEEVATPARRVVSTVGEGRPSMRLLEGNVERRVTIAATPAAAAAGRTRRSRQPRRVLPSPTNTTGGGLVAPMGPRGETQHPMQRLRVEAAARSGGVASRTRRGQVSRRSTNDSSTPSKSTSETKTKANRKNTRQKSPSPFSKHFGRTTITLTPARASSPTNTRTRSPANTRPRSPVTTRTRTRTATAIKKNAAKGKKKVKRLN